ncbi:hypothetical protein ACHQM5_021211 [Ranunculus cassubicifolius]
MNEAHSFKDAKFPEEAILAQAKMKRARAQAALQTTETSKRLAELEQGGDIIWRLMSKLNKKMRTHLKPLKIEDEKFVCVFYEQTIQEGTTIMYFHQAFAYDEECSRTLNVYLDRIGRKPFHGKTNY